MAKPRRDPFGLDIASALRGWDFEAGQVNVRLIRGDDGRPKLQLRLDLGLLQMELNGRPDGKRPHRNATELDYHTRKLQKHLTHYGSDNGFYLSRTDCQALREESAMFYHRYLSLFVLEQFDAVVRDTAHNIGVLDLCHKYGKSDYDRMCLEQYRPYICMMHARACACDALQHNYVHTAIAYLRGGIKQILRIVPKAQRHDTREQSSEIRILADMLRQLRAQLPPDPRTIIKKKLKLALADERYEEAALLRDELLALHTAEHQPKKRKSKSKVAPLADGMKAAPPAPPAPNTPSASAVPTDSPAKTHEGADLPSTTPHAPRAPAPRRRPPKKPPEST